MRTLTANQKARAAECLALAYSHYGVAQHLISSNDYAAAIGKLYYAAIFSAQAACLELSGSSKKHSYWKGQFNKHFGTGSGWVPKLYPKVLNELYNLREEADYRGTLPNNEKLAVKYNALVDNLLKKVRGNTPLLLYPEFICDFLAKNEGILAVEFDYYCPKSYIHKERVQMQLQSRGFTERTVRHAVKSGKLAISELKVSRPEDYVLGWNSRLGQEADAFLLFLDIDENDEALVKAALKKRKGWLFKTGSGYHFVCKEVHPSHKQWVHRMNQAAKSKALKGLVDSKHINFSEKRGYATLRVGSSAVKGFVPFMCWDNSK